jgi:DNA-binding NtrC family response regulator
VAFWTSRVSLAKAPLSASFYPPPLRSRRTLLPPLSSNPHRFPPEGKPFCSSIDEEDIRELATITLEAQGYRVLSAANAEEALIIAEKHAAEIRALVTDIVMPGLTGVQLASLLARIIPSLRILFVSGHNNESIAADTSLAAQSDYLQKPYRGHVLAAKVCEVLTAPRLRPAAAWSTEDLAEAV